MTTVLHAIVAPGLLGSGAVRTGALVGGIAAVVCGVLGVLTVLRSQAFAGHAMGDIASTGGAGAFLVGAAALPGFVGAGLVAAVAMELIGLQRARRQDLATGIVLGAGLGLSSLLLYLDTTSTTTSGATVTVLFGSLFSIDPSTVGPALALGVAVLVAVATVYRPLLYASISPDLAAVRGVKVRRLGMLHLACLAVAVALSSFTVGSILSTALLIGPAAAAVQITRRPAVAMAIAAAGGLLATWAGIVLAWDSAQWPPEGRGWPVSFFVVTLILVAYLAASHLAGRRSTER